MMDLMESQVDERARKDAEDLGRAFEDLYESVNVKTSLSYSDEGPLEACLRACGADPRMVDRSIEDDEERMRSACLPQGVNYRVVELWKGWWKTAFQPMLGTLKTGEQVALIPGRFGGYGFSDPSGMRRVRLSKRTAGLLEPSAVCFYRALPQRSLALRDLMAFVMHAVKPGDAAKLIAMAACIALVGLLPAWANQLAFDYVIPSGSVGVIAPLGALLLGITVSSVLLGISRSLASRKIGMKLNVECEAAVYSRMLVLPARFFKEYQAGELSTRIASVTQLMQAMTDVVLESGLTVLFSLIYVVQVATFAPALVIPAVAVVLVQVALSVVATLVQLRYERATMEATAKLSGTVASLLTGVDKIKLAGAEDRAFARWAKGYASYARSRYNRPVLLRALPAIVGLVSGLGTVMFYGIAGATHMGLADYMAFNVAFGNVTGAIMAASGMAGQVAHIRSLAEQVEPVLRAVPEADEGKPLVGDVTGGFEMSHVSFRYDESLPWVVDDLSLAVAPGEYVALVGESGCGKSTVLRLLLGFEVPERGSIRYGSYDLSEVNARSLREKAIGTVMQDGKLFPGSIFENIIVSAPTSTLDDAWAAAEIAGIADDIRDMPMGMQTLISEGSGGVSGGQRQRLLIARAVCGNRKILMLDEATSALDNVTQKHVSDALAELKCTRLVIAHRLSTVRHCDRIVLLEAGRIAEQGTYEELIAADGKFAELVRRQRLADDGTGSLVYNEAKDWK